MSLDRAHRRFLGYAALASVVFVVIAVLLAHTVPTPATTRTSTAALVFCGTITMISAIHRVRHATGRRARAWLVLTFGAVCGVAANTWSFVTNLSPLPDTWYRWSDPLLLLALLCCTAGLVLFAPVGRRRTDVARMVLDGLVIGGSVLFIASVTVFPQLLTAAEDQSLIGRAQVLFLPVMDVLIATLATLMITRSGRGSRVPLVLLGAGFCLYAVSDLSYAVLGTSYDQPLGTAGDLGWMAGYLLFALAARHPSSGRNPVADRHETSAVLSTVLLFALFLGATVASVLRMRQSALETAQAVVWIVVILAVVGRQVLLIVDNEGLRRSLSVRVAERTRELRDITKQQELLLTSVGDGIYGLDEHGTITFVNAAAARLLGRRESDLIGADAHDLFHAPQSDGTPFPSDGCYINEAIRFGISTSAEDDSYVRGDGQVIAVEATTSPLSADDHISGAVVVFRDVSHRREVDRMKSEFVSIVSHELRTPLTSIRGSLGLVAGGALGTLPPPAHRMIDIAMAGSDRLTRLINDILDIERIESGTMPVDVQACDVASLCEEAVTMISGLPDTAQVDIVLGPCGGSVQADRDRTVQALINLLGNAVKFSPPGSQVELCAEPSGEEVEFSVTDHGRGIPADRLDVIFDRFTQVDSTDAREKGGTGLGLAISRALVERQGGRIWAESTLGEGSTFRFTLPAAAPTKVTAHLDEEADDAGGTRGQGPGAVLLVEDDDALADVVQARLERRGVSVRRAADRAGALVMLAQDPPDVLVLDLTLPDGSGFDVVAALRAEGRTGMPLVVYSATDIGPGERERLTLGARTVFFTKSRVTPEELERRVVELMDRMTMRPVTPPGGEMAATDTAQAPAGPA